MNLSEDLIYHSSSEEPSVIKPSYEDLDRQNSKQKASNKKKFNQKQRKQEAPNKQLISACNGIFSALTRNSSQLGKYISQASHTYRASFQERPESQLKRYLSSLHQKNSIFTPLFYKEAIRELFQIIKQKIQYAWITIQSSLKEQYEYIATNYQDRHKKHIKLFRFYKQTLKAKDMFKVDIIGLFLRRNKQYNSYYPNMKQVISKQSLSNIFDLQKNELEDIHERFTYYEEWIRFDKELQFSDLITIATIVQLKYRIINSTHRYPQSKYGKTSLLTIEIGKFKFQERLLSQQSLKKPLEDRSFKFKFCELVFLHSGNSFVLKPFAIKSEISSKLLKIGSLPLKLERQRLFLNVKYQYNISIGTLYSEYESINHQHTSQKGVNYLGQSLVMLDDIGNLEWRYFKDQKLPRKLLQMNIQYNSRHYLYEKTVLSALCQKVIRRQALLYSVMKVQTEVQAQLGRQLIYLCRFNYSYDELIQRKAMKSSTIRPPLEKDINLELVLALTDKGCLFATLVQPSIEYSYYCKCLRNFFSKVNISNFTLVLYEGNAKRKIAWQAYIYTCIYFRKTFNSHVYVAHSPQYFMRHLAFDNMVSDILFNIVVQEANFRDLVIKIIAKLLKIFVKRWQDIPQGSKVNDRSQQFY